MEQRSAERNRGQQNRGKQNRTEERLAEHKCMYSIAVSIMLNAPGKK